MSQPIEFNLLLKQLKLFIDENSLRYTESACDINRKKLNQILSEEIRPTFEETFKICKLVAPEKITDVIYELFPDIAELLISSLPVDPIKNKFLPVEIESYLRNEKYHDLMTVCSFGSGLTMEEISVKFGAFGVRYAKELLDVGILKNRTGKIKFEANFTQATLDTQIDRLTHSLKNYKKEKRGTKTNALIYRPFKVDKASLHKIHEMLTEANEKLETIISEAKVSNEEKEIYFVGLCLDSYGQE